MDLSEAVFREVGLQPQRIRQSGRIGAAAHVGRAGRRARRSRSRPSAPSRCALKSARVGRNPKTGDEVPIRPRRVLTFRPSHLMKDRVAAGKK
jgi:integration host factor subunit alpha